MLLKTDRSLLLVVDMQERLVPAVHESQQLVENCAWLIKLAREMGVPLRVSQQYRKGLGPTVPTLRELVEADELMDKVHFSCASEESCREALLETGRDQIVVAGVEAHICVLQTALNLAELGKSVFVVADAISSRDPRNVDLTLARLHKGGVTVVSREMVLFEWAHKAGTDQFRHLSKHYLR